MLFLTLGLLAFSMNAQTTYYEDFRYENTGRGFTVQKVNDGGQAGELGKRIDDIVGPNGAFGDDSAGLFTTSTRPSTRTPNGGTREQRAISFKNTSGTGVTLANHEIEGWAMMTNQDLST